MMRPRPSSIIFEDRSKAAFLDTMRCAADPAIVKRFAGQINAGKNYSNDRSKSAMSSQARCWTFIAPIDRGDLHIRPRNWMLLILTLP